MTNDNAEIKTRFSLSVTKFNTDGWGPCTLPDKFKDMPYQPFSKDTKVGKVADWSGNIYPKRYYNKYASQFGAGTQYAYYHEEDESTFQLVDTNRQQKTPYQKQRIRFNAQRLKRDRDRKNQTGNMSALGTLGGGTQVLNKAQMLRERERQRQIHKYAKMYLGRQQNMDYGNQGGKRGQGGGRGGGGQGQTLRDASVKIKPEYEVKEELDFPRLMKLTSPGIKEPEDLICCGEMEFYDKAYDRVTTRNEKPLTKVNRVMHMVTTSHDPIIRILAKQEKGNVFCTDTIMATLMCCTRSVYSWDIIIQKLGDKLFLDKREASDFDLLTVNETAQEQPSEEVGHINSAKNLALEATFIQHNFSQLVLKSDEPKFAFPNANPFAEELGNPAELASVGYRYRRWDLGNNIQLIARCEHDAVTRASSQNDDEEGAIQFMSIKTLNEWDAKRDWRAKLDTQRVSALLAVEFKNNSFKLAKGTMRALLAGSDQIKFGFVSRVTPKDSTKHTILGTQQFKPSEFASQINLNVDNCWGILKCIINMCMTFQDGKYLAMKDPNKQMFRIYKIPDNEFDSEGEDSDEDESDYDEDSRNNNVIDEEADDTVPTAEVEN